MVTLDLMQVITDTFTAKNIEDEVSMLRQISRERITEMQVAEALALANVPSMPEVLDSSQVMWVQNMSRNRGQNEDHRKQSWNDMLWLITLTFTMEHGHVTESQLSHLLVSWASNKENCIDDTFILQHSMELAKMYIASLQSIGWISTTTKQAPYVAPDGQAMLLHVYPVVDMIKESLEMHRAKLQKHVYMKCQPLLNKPKPWTDNFTGVAENSGLQLVKGYPEVEITPEVLKAVNNLQGVEYEVHPDILSLCNLVLDNEDMFRTLWGHTDDEWKSIRLQWIQFRTLRTDTGYYFPVTCDYRGRMYYRGGLVHPQAADFCKAGFTFRKKFPLGSSGFPALCIAFANAIGCKGSVSQKVRYVEQMVEVQEGASESAMQFLTKNFMHVCDMYPSADHCQTWVTGLEILRALEHKKAFGTFDTFPSNLPCHQDGCCNGLQHQAALTKDRVTAEATNIVQQTWKDAPNDVYTRVANLMTKFPELSGNRAGAKKPVMLAGYGASEPTIAKKIAEFCTKINIKYMPEYLKGYMACMAQAVPALMKYTNACKSMAEQAIQQGTTEFRLETNDGFVVVQQYIDNEINIIRGGTFSGAIGNTNYLDISKMITALSPNSIHMIDASHLRGVARESRCDIAAVHDSVGSHPCNFFMVNKVIRKQFVDVHEYPWMKYLAEALNVREPQFIGNYDSSEAARAVNMFG